MPYTLKLYTSLKLCRRAPLTKRTDRLVENSSSVPSRIRLENASRIPSPTRTKTMISVSYKYLQLHAPSRSITFLALNKVSILSSRNYFLGPNFDMTSWTPPNWNIRILDEGRTNMTKPWRPCVVCIELVKNSFSCLNTSLVVHFLPSVYSCYRSETTVNLIYRTDACNVHPNATYLLGLQKIIRLVCGGSIYRLAL